MKTKSKTKNAKDQQGGAVWEKVPATSSLYRYIPNGKFYMVARIKGRLVRECLETTDLTLAKRKLLDAKDRRKTQVGEITLLQLAEEFKASRNGKNQKHIDWMTNKLKSGCPFSSSIVRKINPIEISKFVSSLKLNPRSNNLFFETLKGVFELGVIGGYLQSNPMEKLKKALRKKVTRTLPHIPTFEQFQEIVKTIRNQKFSDSAKDSADIVQFLGLAGLGLAEASNLSFSDLDFETGKMRIQRQKTKVYAMVPMFPSLKPFLLALWENAGKPKAGKVFKVQNPKKAIDHACKVCNYRKFTARNFRQMAIVGWLRKGIDVKNVAKWQLHQDGGVLIMKIYSEVISETASDYEADQLKKLEPTE